MGLGVKSELFEITRADLAFTPDEIATLFRQRTGQNLMLRDAETLAPETEGWIMALQLLGGRLRMAQTINRLPGQLDILFDFLTQDVLAHHSPEMRRFMAETSILSQMDVAVCNAIREREDSHKFLTYLERHSLFLIPLGPDSFRYHNLCWLLSSSAYSDAVFAPYGITNKKSYWIKIQ